MKTMFVWGLMPGNQQQAFAHGFPGHDITFEAGRAAINKLGRYDVVVVCCAWIRHDRLANLKRDLFPGTKLIFTHTRGVSGIVRDAKSVLEPAAGHPMAAAATGGHSRRASTGTA